jgi:hypothetical protein
VKTLHPVTKAAATHGLDLTAAPTCAPTSVPDADEWVRVKREVGTNGLVGLLAAAYEDGAVRLTDEQAEDVADYQLTAAMTAVEVEAALIEMLALIERHGIPVRVLKGVASAHLDYPDSAWRTFNDVDLLVRGTDLDRLVRVLMTAGHPRELPERRPGFDRRFGKDITVYGPNLVQLDLHRTFAVGAFGFRQRLDDLWADSTSFVLGGRTVHALVPEDRFLHACFAATVVDESPRVALLRDMAQLLSRPELDADVVVHRATAWRCEPVVNAAVDIAGRVLGALPPSTIVTWARTRPTRRHERALLAAYPGFGGSHPLAVLSGFVGVGGLEAKLTYARDLLAPDAAYRRARARAGRRPEWRLLAGGLRRATRRSGTQ